MALARRAAKQDVLARQACDRLRAKHAQTPRHFVANDAAWGLALAGRDPDEFAAALQLARAAVEELPKNPGYLTTLGAALYRAGSPREALARLKESTEVKVEKWLFLAMTHHALGQATEAKQHLKQAVTLIDEEAKRPAGQKRSAVWQRLAWTLLRQEAEALLKPAAS
jgi:predicted Zn-dependent protease